MDNPTVPVLFWKLIAGIASFLIVATVIGAALDARANGKSATIVNLMPLTAAVVLVGPLRLLWVQALAALLSLVLLGFRFSWPVSATPGAFHLRIVSCNINTGSFGLPAVVRSLRAANADVILLQEVDSRDYAQLREGMAGYVIHESGQFWMASRFPIQEVADPPHVTQMGFTRSLRYVRSVVVTPAGPVAVYNVHPISPRDGLTQAWDGGILRLFRSPARATVTDNTNLRLTQLQALAADARQSATWVVMAGDTNLPGLSWAFARWLGEFRDGFAEAGNGLGYTFPAPRKPWMRIDRIIADPRLRFLDFRTLQEPISDHRAVVADLELPAPVTTGR
jgi:endonuclease/exonuclease/phosphatase family metal-dependent hydrolase